MANYVSTNITKTNGKTKVIDFCDNLIPANIEDYANLHGSGGGHHAPKSTILCHICDYSKGTGDKSVTVKANLSVDTIYRLYKVAKQTIFKSEPAKSGYVLSERVVKMLNGTYKNLQNLYKAATSEKGVTADNILQVGQEYKQVFQEIVNSKASEAGKPDFTHTQDRVNVYQINKTMGTAPVTKLSITHTPIRSDGQVSNYPWYIKITNGIAAVREQQNGATSYDSKKFNVTAEATINVSDEDMFRMMHSVTRYIEIWENTTCIPLVQQGLQRREEERRAARNNRT